MWQKLLQGRKGPTKPLSDASKKSKTKPHTAGTQGAPSTRGSGPEAQSREIGSVTPEGSCNAGPELASLPEENQGTCLQSAAAEAAVSSQRLFCQAGLLTPGELPAPLGIDKHEAIVSTTKRPYLGMSKVPFNP